MGREMRGRHEAATVWQYRAVLATGGSPESVITSAVLEQRPFLGHHAMQRNTVSGFLGCRGQVSETVFEKQYGGCKSKVTVLAE